MITTYQTKSAPHTKIEVVKDGPVLQYVMTGQSISEQVGSSRLPESELLEVLLAPIGQRVENGVIINAIA